MTEQDIIRVLSERRPVGTEGFRDALLARCLAVIDADEGSAYLEDEELEMLAAASGGSAGAAGAPWGAEVWPPGR